MKDGVLETGAGRPGGARPARARGRRRGPGAAAGVKVRVGGGAPGSGAGLRLAVLGLLGLLGLGVAPAGVGGQTAMNCAFDDYGSGYCSGLSFNGIYCQTDPQACQGCCYSCRLNANECWPAPPPPPPAAAPAPTPAPPAAPECRSLVPGCPGYVAQGMCESEPDFMCHSCCATCQASGFCLPSPPPPPPPPPPQAQSVCTLAELRTALTYLRHYSRITLTCHLTGLTETDELAFNRGGTAGEQDLEIVGQCGPSGQDKCEIVGNGNAPNIVPQSGFGESPYQFNKGPSITVTADYACMPDGGRELLTPDGQSGTGKRACTRDELVAMGPLQVTFRNLVFKKGQGFNINGHLHVDFFNCDFIQLAKERQGGAIKLQQMLYWHEPTETIPYWRTTQGFPSRVRATYAQFTGNKAYLTHPSSAQGGAIFIGPHCEMHLQDATFSGNSAPQHPDAYSSYLCRPRSFCDSKGPNVYHSGWCGNLGIIYVYPGCNIAASSSGTGDE